MTREERKVGHNALRFKDGKIEHFDPHPQITNEQDEKEFEEYWEQVSHGRSMNTEFGNLKEWSRNAWLASRRLLRQQRAFNIADSFPCATIDEGEGE